MRKLRSLLALTTLIALNALATAPSGRYVVTAGTVYDNTTKLTWQRDTTPGGVGSWVNASLYCGSLTLNGSGWRLPNVVELRSLLDREQTPTIDPTAFPGTPTDIPFWTATQVASDVGLKWVVEFWGGTSSGDYVVSGANYVRCVR
jgi:hypothetical protein